MSTTGTARLAGRAALAEHGYDGGDVTVYAPAGFVRCGIVVADATVPVDALPLPFVGDLLAHTASARHAEILEPLRSGLAGDAAACLPGG